MREEFVAQLDPFAQYLPDGLNVTYRLERLHKDSALLAIKEPLKNTRRSFAAGVAEKLVENL